MPKNIIDVHINRAILDSFAVDIKDNNGESHIEIEARLTLFAGEKEITTVTVGTQSWRKVSIDLHPMTARSIGRIVKSLEKQAKACFMQEMAQLPKGKEI